MEEDIGQGMRVSLTVKTFGKPQSIFFKIATVELSQVAKGKAVYGVFTLDT
jgi:hypothetical protein